LTDSRRELDNPPWPTKTETRESPNPASASSFDDVFIRDLTHERPLHLETPR